MAHSYFNTETSKADIYERTVESFSLMMDDFYPDAARMMESLRLNQAEQMYIQKAEEKQHITTHGTEITCPTCPPGCDCGCECHTRKNDFSSAVSQ